MPIQQLIERTPDNRPVLFDAEEISFTEENVEWHLGGNLEGKGKLHLTTERVIWLSTEDNKAYAVTYPDIVLHAVCRDLDSFPKPCLYCQISFTEEENDSNDIEDLDIPELRIIPANDTVLDELFQKFAEMSAMHPDDEITTDDGEPADDDDESDGWVWAEGMDPNAIQNLGDIQTLGDIGDGGDTGDMETDEPVKKDGN
eukprot:Platyproteum_vivax@DN7311_c1_g1_i1.p1